MRVAVITLDARSGSLVDALLRRLDAVELRAGRDGPLAELFRRAFAEYRGLVCVMAAGIAVRMVSPLAESKYKDPAVVVLDDAGRWAISLLSGHEGGANALAYETAAATGAEPVITTGSETLRRGIIGVGCRRGAQAAEVRAAVTAALAEADLAASDIRQGASIILKSEEGGLIEAFRELGIPLVFIPEERINSYAGPYEKSEAAERNLGVRAVAEPCALLAGRRARLILKKRVYGAVTVAVALEDNPWEA